MKRITGFLSLIAIVFITACSEKPAEVKKEVIVVPAPVVIKQPDVIIVKEPEEKATTISLDKNGVKVKTKKVNVILDKQ